MSTRPKAASLTPYCAWMSGTRAAHEAYRKPLIAKAASTATRWVRSG